MLVNLLPPLIGEKIQKIIGFSILSIYGIIIILLYLIGPLLAPNLSTLSCLRGEYSEFSCEFISSGIFGTYTNHIPSGELQSAEIDETCDGGDCSYGVFLKTTRGKIYIPTSYSSEFDAQEDRDRINLFIKNKNQKTLMLRKDNRWMIIYTVILCGGLILFILYLVASIFERYISFRRR